tara:strand:- start:4 stop:624 length:621 start_codon:yes stop_codon:yes gene_type:complete
MPDFKNAKIYKLWCHEIDDIYIGSTTQSLSQRLSGHKSLDCSSKILFEKSNSVKIELIEEFPCDNKMQLNKKEGEHIRKNDCVNKLIAGRTKKEWYVNNKEKYKEYRENNKKEIAEKMKEFYVNNKEKYTEYYENNKKEIAEKKKFKIMCNLCKCNIRKSDFIIHTKSLKHYGALTAATAATGLADGITDTSLDSTDTGCLLDIKS